MAKIKRWPYYKMNPTLLPFTASKWQAYLGSRGCVAISTSQKILYERLAPGELPQPKPVDEQVKVQQAEPARPTLFENHVEKQQTQQLSKRSTATDHFEAENHEKIPEFDLQDVPDAMDSIGWPIAAKIARKWFAGSRHIYNDRPNSEQPIDNTTVTLKWALKFGSVQKKLDQLIGERIYSPSAIKEARTKVARQLATIFVDKNSVNFSFDTTPLISDQRQFHIDWQFQFQEIPTSATLDGLLLTDLTATLGSFNLYAAIGRVRISTEKYFQYSKSAKTKAYCIDAVAAITHIFVYLKDNYSFNDKGDGNSQYLGHWNKSDMILSYRAVISDLIDGRKIHTRMGGSEITETAINWAYLPGDAISNPVDKRPSLRKLLNKNVYYPVYNRNYNEWREKRNRGGDFMIYSRPQLFELRRPIQFKLEAICRPSEPM